MRIPCHKLHRPVGIAALALLVIASLNVRVDEPK